MRYSTLSICQIRSLDMRALGQYALPIYFTMWCSRPTAPGLSPAGEKYRGLLFSQFIAQISHANRDSLEQSLNYRRYRRRQSEKYMAQLSTTRA